MGIEKDKSKQTNSYGSRHIKKSKNHMYTFHYKYIKIEYDKKAKMLITDTYSFYYIIETQRTI